MSSPYALLWSTVDFSFLLVQWLHWLCTYEPVTLIHHDQELCRQLLEPISSVSVCHNWLMRQLSLMKACRSSCLNCRGIHRRNTQQASIMNIYLLPFLPHHEVSRLQHGRNVVMPRKLSRSCVCYFIRTLEGFVAVYCCHCCGKWSTRELSKWNLLPSICAANLHNKLPVVTCHTAGLLLLVQSTSCLKRRNVGFSVVKYFDFLIHMSQSVLFMNFSRINCDSVYVRAYFKSILKITSCCLADCQLLHMPVIVNEYRLLLCPAPDRWGH